MCLGLKRVYISVTLDQTFIWTQGQGTDFAGQRSKVTVTSLLVGLLMEEQSHDQVEVWCTVTLDINMYSLVFI